jgi:hypothetical protein
MATGDELTHWLQDAPIDPSTFRTAQPIYTASPVFVGRTDHLPVRIVGVPGACAVQVPAAELLCFPKRTKTRSSVSQGASTTDVEAFVERVLDRLRNAPDGEKHDTLRKCARLLGGVQTQIGLSDTEIIARLIDALPASAIDLIAAAKTAEWGLASGRQVPIAIETRLSCSVGGDDPQRKETARLCLRLLQAGLPSAQLLRHLHRKNAERSNPLPCRVVNEIAFWAARHAR